MLFLYRSQVVGKTLKILEKVVNFQLQQYLKKAELLSPAQSGLRQHHSTESAEFISLMRSEEMRMLED